MRNTQLHADALKAAWFINANNTGTTVRGIIVQQDNSGIQSDSDRQLSIAAITNWQCMLMYKFAYVMCSALTGR